MDTLIAFDVNPTVGALEIGTLVSMFLFGIVTLQVYLYYRNFPKDNALLKIVVRRIRLCVTFRYLD